MKIENLWLIAGMLAAAGLPLTAAAGICLAGKNECTVDAASLSPTMQKSGGAMEAVASAKPSRLKKPDIVAINKSPEGQTYGRWAVEWWQWAVGIPGAVNPVADTTGEHCAQRQVGDVWFLAGSFSSAPVVRDCDVPVGKSLFFPLINTIYGAFLNDPLETRTEEYARAAGSCSVPANISVQIDGFGVFKPTKYFTGASGSQSPIFNVQLPPGNVFGLYETAANELVLSPSAEQGYYLFVEPLSVGSHTIRLIASGCTPGGSQDITYNLTVY